MAGKCGAENVPSPVLLSDTGENLPANRITPGDRVQTHLDNGNAMLVDEFELTQAARRKMGQEAQPTDNEGQEVTQHKDNSECNERVSLLEGAQKPQPEIA